MNTFPLHDEITYQATASRSSVARAGACFSWRSTIQKFVFHNIVAFKLVTLNNEAHPSYPTIPSQTLKQSNEHPQDNSMAILMNQPAPRTFNKSFEIPEEVMDNLLFRFIHNLPDHEVSGIYWHWRVTLKERCHLEEQ